MQSLEDARQILFDHFSDSRTLAGSGCGAARTTDFLGGGAAYAVMGKRRSGIRNAIFMGASLCQSCPDFQSPPQPRPR